MVNFEKDREKQFQNPFDADRADSRDSVETIYPRESSTFGSLTPTAINETNPVIPLTASHFLWKQDRIGLRALAEKGGLQYGTSEESCPGAHMDLEWGDEDGCGQRLVRRWIGWPA